MLITLVLLSLSLTPVRVISSPLNVEPTDITRREAACIAKSNCGVTNDDGGKPGKPKPNPVDPQSPYDAQPALPNPSGKPNPNTKPTDLLTAPDIQWPDPDKGPELFDFEYKCRGRSRDDQLLILNELLVARDILKKGYTIFSMSPFYHAMFAPSLMNNPSFELQAQTKYAYAFAIFTRSDYKVKITCDQNLCMENTVALVITRLNILNLCDLWFDDKVKAKSEVAANECKAGNEKANNWKNLAKFKATKCMIAHLHHNVSHKAANINATAFTLVHEIMHTRYPTQGVDTPPVYVPSLFGAETPGINLVVWRHG